MIIFMIYFSLMYSKSIVMVVYNLHALQSVTSCSCVYHTRTLQQVPDYLRFRQSDVLTIFSDFVGLRRNQTTKPRWFIPLSQGHKMIT